jgi:hypothetical protein
MNTSNKHQESEDVSIPTMLSSSVLLCVHISISSTVHFDQSKKDFAFGIVSTLLSSDMQRRERQANLTFCEDTFFACATSPLSAVSS